jgi:hypothetical protein
MTVFQQAKDMKIDPAYLFFCISGLMLLFHTWVGEKDSKKIDYKILAVIGIIVGFTFSVKITSVMLILGCIGVMSYRILGFSGYLGFFALFLAIFTKLHLWSMMNVPMPTDLRLINLITSFLGFIGLTLLIVSIYRNNLFDIKKIQLWIISSLIFSVGTLA